MATVLTPWTPVFRRTMMSSRVRPALFRRTIFDFARSDADAVKQYDALARYCSGKDTGFDIGHILKRVEESRQVFVLRTSIKNSEGVAFNSFGVYQGDDARPEGMISLRNSAGNMTPDIATTLGKVLHEIVHAWSFDCMAQTKGSAATAQAHHDRPHTRLADEIVSHYVQKRFEGQSVEEAAHWAVEAIRTYQQRGIVAGTSVADASHVFLNVNLYERQRDLIDGDGGMDALRISLLKAAATQPAPSSTTRE